MIGKGGVLICRRWKIAHSEPWRCINLVAHIADYDVTPARNASVLDMETIRQANQLPLPIATTPDNLSCLPAVRTAKFDVPYTSDGHV